MKKKLLVTGGAGFIGSAVIRHIINHTEHNVVNADKLTYAGNLESLRSIEGSDRYLFERVDICDASSMKRILAQQKPDIIIHLAAESHVDRSIDASPQFVRTNIVGTHVLLEAATRYHSTLGGGKTKFRFHHVSTDEVYGSLDENAKDVFTEKTPYAPNSPYAASKAASDHLVRAWHKTFGLPTVMTNCSNNYGPYQFPEKLIPLTILNALEGKSLPVYGDGKQKRDWLYVEDHAMALLQVALYGDNGESYNIGGNSETTNIEVVKTICAILNTLVPPRSLPVARYEELITLVEDRPGHDRRYAINTAKINSALGWKPTETFATGMHKTIRWYLNNEDWHQKITDATYQRQRLGRLTQ